MSDLGKLLEKWQKRLGLSDWGISVRTRDARDMNQCPGHTKIQANIQRADVRLMRPEDRQACDPGDEDIELDLVHELIHIRLWSIDPSDASGALYTCREQAVEWIAKALIASDREA